ncbi:MAG TPA: 2-hydroxychromene-2-carboxylate isomerase [Polyangiaceae bacterium]|nr:2-hydroxychromene-2-carboxylate isomerase [Polyangiaceae bacterium]
MKPVEFWFEYASTYSYPAAHRLPVLAKRAGVDVVFRPFLLGPLFAAQGWNDSPFNLYPVKGRYMWRDLERICEREQLPFVRPSRFPRNGLLAARVTIAFEEEPWISDFVRSVYTANFAEDRDISTEEFVSSLLGRLGRDAASDLRAARTDENKAKLRDRTERARSLGLFGSPTFVVGGELFWGNDRLEQALAWALR